MCVALLGWGLMTLALPVLSFGYSAAAAAHQSTEGNMVTLWWVLLLGSRMLLGIFEGAVFPAAYTMLSRWTPLSEKTRATVLVTTGKCLLCFSLQSRSHVAQQKLGQDIGTILSMGLSPLLVRFIKWRGLFYLYGGMTLAFIPALFFLSSSSPETHRFISVAERLYILESRSPNALTSFWDVPWKQIAKVCKGSLFFLVCFVSTFHLLCFIESAFLCFVLCACFFQLIVVHFAGLFALYFSRDGC